VQARNFEEEAEHSRAVREMFSGIARRYDLLNHLLSLNIDKAWRRRVKRELGDLLARSDARVLDVACGTGDLSLELKQGARCAVFGTDFCRPMLAIAGEKAAVIGTHLPLVEADAMRLPFPEESFDAVTIAFGLRNLPNVEQGLIELSRILKPGGRLVVLEFSKPKVPGFGQLFNLYFSHVLPRIGGALSGSRGAYEYLPRSVSKFPDQRSLVRLMQECGLANVTYSDLTGGIAALHLGTKEL
jgi:demethylmenaquinone methyltransferase/2-methoxy-6-polyprenyl-1,4-benzoquinol methylase